MSSGVLSMLPSETTISEIANEIDNVIKNSTLQELIVKGVVSKPADYDSLKDYETTIDDTSNGGKKIVSELTMPEMIEYCLDLIEISKTISGN